MNRHIALTLTCSLWVVASVGAADDAAAIFDSLYGERARAAEATASKADDVALASELVAAAKTVKGQPEVVGYLCEKAVGLVAGDHSVESQGVALEALGLLAERVPGKADAAIERRLPLLQTMFAGVRGDERVAVGVRLIDDLLHVAGLRESQAEWLEASALYRKALGVATQTRSARREAIRAAADRATQRRRVAQVIEQLKGKLKADPNDAVSAKRLIDHLIIDMGDLEEAQKYSFLLRDAAAKENLARARRPIEELDDSDAMAMGDWYREMATRASSGTEAALLRRALAYYDRFLEAHPATDLYRTKVELARREVAGRLQAVAPHAADVGAGGGAGAGAGGGAPSRGVAGGGDFAAPVRGGRSAELLKLLKLDKHLVTGKPSDCRRKGAGFTIANGYGGGVPSVALPAVPRGNYELRVEYQLGKNIKGGLAVYLPVGEGGVELTVRENGQAWLREVAGESFPDRKSPVHLAKPEPGKPWTLIVRVMVKGDAAAIVVGTVGTKTPLEWSGPQSALKTRPWVHKLGCIGIGVVDHPSREVTSVTLRMLTGRMLIVADEAIASLSKDERGG